MDFEYHLRGVSTIKVRNTTRYKVAEYYEPTDQPYIVFFNMDVCQMSFGLGKCFM